MREGTGLLPAVERQDPQVADGVVNLAYHDPDLGAFCFDDRALAAGLSFSSAAILAHSDECGYEINSAR